VQRPLLQERSKKPLLFPYQRQPRWYADRLAPSRCVDCDGRLVVSPGCTFDTAFAARQQISKTHMSQATDASVDSSQPISLDDKYDLNCGRIFANGAQALVRATLMQKQIDEASGLNTAGYVSGYRGSPLGGVDLQFWKAKHWLQKSSVLFEPGINEDLVATAIVGTRQAAELPQPKHDGIFGMWYGKGPGVDRAGGALKHANYSGSSRLGGVIAVFSDDHPGKSSTIAYHSEQALMSFCMPVLYPASVQGYIDFALAGWAMSRHCGLWVGFKAVNETVESTGSIDVDPSRHDFIFPEGEELPATGIHVALRYAPQEDDLLVQRYRIPRALAFARAKGLNKVTVSVDRGLGIVSSGKAYLDVMDTLYALGIDASKAKAIGLSVYKVGMVWPLEPEGLREFATARQELLFVEEKRAIIEPQAAHLLFNLTDNERPRIVGKMDDTSLDNVPFRHATHHQHGGAGHRQSPGKTRPCRRGRSRPCRNNPRRN
jgi:indolepyruvate ferredoxin oxidoreductase